MRQHISRAYLVGAGSLILLGMVGSAQAAVMQNAGFEALTGSDPSHFSGGVLIDGHATASANPLGTPQIYVTSDPAPSWNVDTQAGGTMNPTDAVMPSGPLGGEYVGYSTGSILSQVMTWDIEPSTRYTLTIGVGHTTLSGPFAYHIWFSSGGLVLADDNNSVAIPAGEWGMSTVTWDSPSDVPAGSKLVVNLASSNGLVLFDSAQVSGGPIAPEPASTTLLVAPVLAMFARRRRQAGR
jgi:hypothetical protein